MVAGVVAGVETGGAPTDGTVTGLVGVPAPAPFARTVFDRPGWAQAAIAVKRPAAATDPTTTTLVTTETRRSPASRARSAREREVREVSGGIPSASTAPLRATFESIKNFARGLRQRITPVCPRE